MSELLTIPDAAARRGCTEVAIKAAIADGRLKTYDSPSGEVHVWADDVDKLGPARHPNRSGGEELLHVADVPGDDTAILAEFTSEELEMISDSLTFAGARRRLHILQKPVLERLRLRFYRLVTSKRDRPKPP